MKLFVKRALGAALFATALRDAIVWIPMTFFGDATILKSDVFLFLLPFLLAVIIGAFFRASIKKTAIISLLLFVITFLISITLCQPSEGCGGLRWNIIHQGGILILSSLLYLFPVASIGGFVGAALHHYLVKRSIGS